MAVVEEIGLAAPYEKRKITMDFAPDLGDTGHIAAATITAIAVNDVTGEVSTDDVIVDGTIAYDGVSVVEVEVQATVAGERHLVHFRCEQTDGQKLQESYRIVME